MSGVRILLSSSAISRGQVVRSGASSCCRAAPSIRRAFASAVTPASTQSLGKGCPNRNHPLGSPLFPVVTPGNVKRCGPCCDHCRSFSSSSSSEVAKTATSAPTKTSADGVAAIPIDFDVASRVEGNESQIVTIALEPGQILRAESGAMMYMTDGVQMNTTTGGGMSAGFKRLVTGQNIFISDYSYHGEPGTTGVVALGTDFPSKIIRINVDQYGGTIVCQKGALLCASHTINIEMEFAKKLTTGFFGGEGFVLQALTGEGEVFVKAGGTLIRRELKDGEQFRISSGCLVAFSSGVDYDVQMMQGFKNVLFGGEGLFVTTLTGPGTVWLQGMPPQRMVSEIARRVPSGGPGLAVPIGMGGSGGEGEGEEGVEEGTSEK